jgi:hypothetical protein
MPEDSSSELLSAVLEEEEVVVKLSDQAVIMSYSTPESPPQASSESMHESHASAVLDLADFNQADAPLTSEGVDNEEEDIPNTIVSNPELQAPASLNLGDPNVENTDTNSIYEPSVPPSNAEGPAILLCKHVEKIFKSRDSNSNHVEETMMSDSEFEKCQSLYESINELPDVKFLVGDPSVTDESTKAFDESLELKFDIDSCLVHAPTPYETAGAFNGIHMCICHPYGFKRNSTSNRILVKTALTSSGKTVRKNVDMARFPNFEVAKLCVSEHAIDFTMNLHIIDEEPPVNGNILTDIQLYAWNAALNLARNRFSISPFFRFCSENEDHAHTAKDLRYVMSVTPAFEVQTSHTKLVKKQLTPVRFNYPTGLLFLEIVWENLRAIASKEVEPQQTEIRFYDGHGSSKIRLSSIQEAAVQLYNCSHTVAQAAGFRHNFPCVIPVDRPSLSSQPELHRWINQEHQKSALTARRKLFSTSACASAFATLDIGINFLSNNPGVVFLMDGFKAQTIVRQTTKVNVEESASYYRGLEHLEEQVDETELPVGHDVFDPRPLLSQKVSKASNLSIVALFSFSCILLFSHAFSFPSSL